MKRQRILNRLRQLALDPFPRVFGNEGIKTLATLNVTTTGTSMWSDISCITGVVHEILRVVTIPCIVFRRVFLHIVCQFANRSSSASH